MRALARLALAFALIGGGLGLVYLFREHRAAVASEEEREAPIVAPSRVEIVDGDPLIVLDTADLRRMGLELAALEPVTAVRERRVAGEVVAEPERVATLRAPLAGRLSVPTGARWPGYGDRLAAGVAIAQVSDARPLSLPISGTVTRLGAQPGELVEAGQVLLEITDFSRPVVRVPWPEGVGARPPERVVVQPPGDARRIVAHLVGSAPEADPVTRRPAFLFRAEQGWPGAVPGTQLVALLAEGRPGSGVLIPDRAVVQWEGLTWAYVQEEPGRFARRRVPGDRPTVGGWVAGAPFAPGDSVVVTGAEQLLSEEFRAQVTVGEEVGE